VKEKPGKCCLENVLSLSAQKSQEFDLFAQKSNLKTIANEKKTKTVYLLACPCLRFLVCSLKTKIQKFVRPQKSFQPCGRKKVQTCTSTFKENKQGFFARRHHCRLLVTLKFKT
jgi:hypothetical protein